MTIPLSFFFLIINVNRNRYDSRADDDCQEDAVCLVVLRDSLVAYRCILGIPVFYTIIITKENFGFGQPHSMPEKNA